MVKKNLIIFLAVFNLCTALFSQHLATPLEKKQYQQLSKHSEIIAYCQSVANTCNYCQYYELGLSATGKPIPMLKFQFNISNDPLKVLYIGQQHGNEPSGKEGLLILIQKLLQPELADKLKNIELYIIPQLNPEGGDAHQRRNGNNIDLNRDHLLLSQPETKALHKLFDSIKHHVTADFHEYYPFDDTTQHFYYVKNIDIQMGGVTNININKSIAQFSYNSIIPEVGNFIKKQNYTFSEYTIGSLVDNEGYRYSTIDINDGRQSFGICNTFSFIFEGINNPTDTGNIQRRAESQAAAATALLLQVNNHADSIKNMVNKARNFLFFANRFDSCCIYMKHEFEGKQLSLQMKHLFTKKDTIITTPLFKSKRQCHHKINMPHGYLIPISDTMLLQWLHNQNIVYFPITTPYHLNITEFLINKITNDTIEEEALQQLEIIENNSKFKNNYLQYYYIPVAQFKSLIIVQALEPASMFALHHSPQFQYLKNNTKYPIIRVNHRVYFF